MYVAEGRRAAVTCSMAKPRDRFAPVIRIICGDFDIFGNGNELILITKGGKAKYVWGFLTLAGESEVVLLARYFGLFMK